MENEMEPDGKNTLKYENEDIESKLKRRSIRLQNLQNTDIPESSPKLPSTNDLKHNNSNGLGLFNKEYDEDNDKKTSSSGSNKIEQSSESLKSPIHLLPLKVIKNPNDRKYFKSKSNTNANSLTDDIHTENVSKAYKIISKPTPAIQSSDLISAAPSKSPLKTYMNPRRFAEKKQPIESFALPDNPLSCEIADITLPEIETVLDTEILDAKEITIQEFQFIDEPWSIIDLDTDFSTINEIRVKVEPQKHVFRTPTKCNVPKDTAPQTIVNKLVDGEKQLKKLPSCKNILNFGKGKNERIITNHNLTLEEHEVEIFNSCTVQNVSDSTSIKTNRLSRHSLNDNVDIPNEVDSKFCSNSNREEINKKQSVEISRNKNDRYSIDLGKAAVDFDVPSKTLRSNSCTNLDDLEPKKLKKSNSQLENIEVGPTKTQRSNSCIDLDDLKKCSELKKLKKSNSQLENIETVFDDRMKTLRSNSCSDLDLEECSEHRNLKKSWGTVKTDVDIPTRTLRSSSYTDLDNDFEKSSEPKKIKKSNTEWGNIEIDFNLPKKILRSNSCIDLSEFDKCEKPEKLKKSNSQIELVSDDNVNKRNNVQKRKPKGNSKQLKVTLYQLPIKSKSNKQTNASKSANNQISNKKPSNLPEKNKNIASCGMILELVDIQRVYTDNNDPPSKSTCERAPIRSNLDDSSETDVTEDEMSFKRKSKSAANAKLTEYFQKPHHPRLTHNIEFSPIGKPLSENIVMKLFEINDVSSSPNSTSTPDKKSIDKSFEKALLSINDRTEEDKQQNYTKEKISGESNKRKKGRPRKIVNKENNELNFETTDTDLSISADSSIEDTPVKHVNKENAAENETSTSIVKENDRLLRSKQIKIQQQTINETKVAEIGDNKRQKIISIEPTNEDNHTKTQKNKSVSKTFEIFQKQDSVNDMDVQTNSQKVVNLNKTKKSSKINGQMTDLTSEIFTPTDIVKRNSTQPLEDLNSNEDISQKSKTNLAGKINDDVYQKRTRSKAGLESMNNSNSKNVLIPENSTPTDIVNSTQALEDLNSNEDISQKITRSKTNLEHRMNDDVCQKRTRSKTGLREPVNDSNSEISTPTNVVEMNSSQSLEDLKRTRSKTNLENDTCQKKTKSKTSLGKLMNDSSIENILPRKTRSKQRINGIKEDLISATLIDSSPTKSLRNKIVERKTTSDKFDLEDRTIQSRVDQCIIPKKSSSRIASMGRNNDSGIKDDLINTTVVNSSHTKGLKKKIVEKDSPKIIETKTASDEIDLEDRTIQSRADQCIIPKKSSSRISSIRRNNDSGIKDDLISTTVIDSSHSKGLKNKIVETKATLDKIDLEDRTIQSRVDQCIILKKSSSRISSMGRNNDNDIKGDLISTSMIDSRHTKGLKKKIVEKDSSKIAETKTTSDKFDLEDRTIQCIIAKKSSSRISSIRRNNDSGIKDDLISTTVIDSSHTKGLKKKIVEKDSPKIVETKAASDENDLEDRTMQLLVDQCIITKKSSRISSLGRNHDNCIKDDVISSTLIDSSPKKGLKKKIVEKDSPKIVETKTTSDKINLEDRTIQSLVDQCIIPKKSSRISSLGRNNDSGIKDDLISTIVIDSSHTKGLKKKSIEKDSPKIVETKTTSDKINLEDRTIQSLVDQCIIPKKSSRISSLGRNNDSGIKDDLISETLIDSSPTKGLKKKIVEKDSPKIVEKKTASDDINLEDRTMQSLVDQCIIPKKSSRISSLGRNNDSGIKDDVISATLIDSCHTKYLKKKIVETKTASDEIDLEDRTIQSLVDQCIIPKKSSRISSLGRNNDSGIKDDVISATLIDSCHTKYLKKKIVETKTASDEIDLEDRTIQSLVDQCIIPKKSSRISSLGRNNDSGIKDDVISATLIDSCHTKYLKKKIVETKTASDEIDLEDRTIQSLVDQSIIPKKSSTISSLGRNNDSGIKDDVISATLIDSCHTKYLKKKIVETKTASDEIDLEDRTIQSLVDQCIIPKQSSRISSLGRNNDSGIKDDVISATLIDSCHTKYLKKKIVETKTASDEIDLEDRTIQSRIDQCIVPKKSSSRISLGRNDDSSIKDDLIITTVVDSSHSKDLKKKIVEKDSPKIVETKTASDLIDLEDRTIPKKSNQLTSDAIEFENDPDKYSRFAGSKRSISSQNISIADIEYDLSSRITRSKSSLGMEIEVDINAEDSSSKIKELEHNMAKEETFGLEMKNTHNNDNDTLNLQENIDNNNKKNICPTKVDIAEQTVDVNKIKPNVKEIFEKSEIRVNLEDKLEKDEAETKRIFSENDASITNIEKCINRKKTLPSRIKSSKRINKNDTNNIIDDNIDSPRKNSLTHVKDILDEESELREILGINMIKENDTSVRIESIQNSDSSKKNLDTKDDKCIASVGDNKNEPSSKICTDDIDSLQNSTKRDSFSVDEPFSLELRDSPCLETEAISNDVSRVTTPIEDIDNLVTSKKRTYRTRSHSKDFAENINVNITNRNIEEEENPLGSKTDLSAKEYSENIKEIALIKERRSSLTKANDEDETIVDQIQTILDAPVENLDNLLTSKKRIYRTRSYNKDFDNGINNVEEQKSFESENKEYLENIEKTALIEECKNSTNKINDEDAAIADQIQTSIIKPEINDSVEVEEEDTRSKTRRSFRRKSLVEIDSKPILDDCKETVPKLEDNDKSTADDIKIRSSLDGKSEVFTTSIEIKRGRGRPKKSVMPAKRYSVNQDDVQIPTRRRSDEARTTHEINHRDRRSNSVGSRNYILKKMFNDYKKYAIPNIANAKLGEIAWAQIGHYPYWPCVITKEPASKMFSKSVLKKYVPNVFYHVRFFGDRGRRAWISRKKLIKFTDRDDIKRMRDSLKEIKPVSELLGFSVKKHLRNKWENAVEEVEHVKSENYNLKQIIKYLETVSVQSEDAQEGEQSETNLSTTSKETQKKKTNKTQDDSTISEPSTEDVHVKKKIKLSTKSSPGISQKEKSPKKKISKALEDEQPSEPVINQDPVELEPVKVEEVVIKDEISDIEYKVSIDSIQHFGNYSLDDQRSLYKRNNLFKGIPKDKVCQFCFNFGDLYRCKGGCQGTYHLQCSVQVLIEKVPKRRKITSPKIETSPPEVRKVEKPEHSSGNQSEVDENHVQIITVPSSVCATPPGKTFPPDAVNMSLAERIDFKMKEIMKKFESKAYLEMLNESTSDEKPTKSPLLRNRSFSMCQDLFSVGNQKTPKRSILFNKELDAMAKINQQSPISVKQIEESLEMILKPSSTKHVTADSPDESPKSSRQTIKDEDDQRQGHVAADTEDSAIESIVKHKSKKPNRTRKSLMKHVTADFPSPADKSVVPVEAKKLNGARKSLLKHVTADTDSVETIDSESLRSTSSRQSKQSEISEHVEVSYKNITPNPKHFKCGFCMEDIDPYCFICHDSVSRSGSNIRQKCSLYRCSRFYHPECLKLWPQTQWSLIQTTKNRFSQEEVDSFVCPQHVCHTCASDDPRAAISRCSGDKIVKCLSCPASYHSTNLCVPAGTDIVTSTQIVCPRHRYKNLKNQTINTTWCFICNEGGNLICCEICPTSVHPECMTVNLTDDDKFICEDCESGRLPLYDEIVWVKVGQHKWWPGLILFPNEVPPNVFNAKHTTGEFVVKFFGTYDHFWVNRGRSFLFQEGDTIDTGSNLKNKAETIFKKAVEEAVVAHKMKKQFKSTQAAETASSLKPPPYIKIKSSKPVGNVRLMELNLSNTTSCECDPFQPNPCGPDSNCLNRLLWTECNPEVCPAGDLCNNQSFEKREYPLLVPYKTEARGWGLKTLESIKKGTFVIEYVGELIDDEEYQRRVTKMHAQKEENYYFLTIHTNRMIDAGPKGNIARFMNHCCQPNCETQKWTVNGETRVGLFATEDIAANAELTFNYNLECNGTEKKVCKCGAPNCSGFIGVKAKQESTELKKPKKYKKKEPVKAIVLPPCFICKKKGNVGVCNNKICNKAYHLRCLKLDEWPEGKKYVCPWHYCNACSKRTIRCCVKCLNSFCPSHSEGNVRYDNLMGFVCNIHEPTKSNTITSVKKKRSTLTSEEAVVTSTTDDIDEEDSFVFRRKSKKSKKPSGDNVIDANSSSIRQSETESQDETISSATASDFEDELQSKRKRKAKSKIKFKRIRIKKRRGNVHEMNTANSNNDSLNSSSNSR